MAAATAVSGHLLSQYGCRWNAYVGSSTRAAAAPEKDSRPVDLGAGDEQSGPPRCPARTILAHHRDHRICPRGAARRIEGFGDQR
jgi:hypothetical protein